MADPVKSNSLFPSKRVNKLHMFKKWAAIPKGLSAHLFL